MWSRAFVMVAVLVAGAGCGAPAVELDAGQHDAGPIECASDSECDDGAFCTGPESCDPSDPGAASDGCVAGAPPCGGEACDEAADRCATECPDADGDGVQAAACGGTDCDDSDGARAPGRAEVCDAMDRDEDCDPATFGFRDADGDGYADGACCNGSVCGDDCSDVAPGVHPGLPETCDLRDNDCDGSIDESVVMTFWADADGDLHGDPSAPTSTGCFLPPMHALVGDDCDDTRMDRHPGLPERCDRATPPATPIDEDCDGTANEECDCADGSTRPCMLSGRCATGVETCVSGTYSTSCSVTPAGETCNGDDDDCDGVVDEMLTVSCFADGDDDSYPAPGAARTDRCPAPGRAAVGGCPTGFTNREPTLGAIDCDDADGAVRPGAPERCNGRDDDCNGAALAEDRDGDMHAALDATCVPDVYPTDDCEDSDADVHPGQTRFFGRAYCPDGMTPCSPEPGVAACLVGFSCTVANGVPSFDYDCDGAETLAPEGFCSTLPMCFGGCAEGSGPRWRTREPACGEPADHLECTCDEGVGLCAGAITGTEAVPCR